MNQKQFEEICKTHGLVRQIKEVYNEQANQPHGLKYQVIAMVNKKNDRFLFNDWTSARREEDIYVTDSDGGIWVDMTEDAIKWVLKDWDSIKGKNNAPGQ